MRPLICAAAMLALAASAAAGERYDRKLEQAAMRIVAENIGDIRGGFSYRQKPRFVAAPDVSVPEAGPVRQPDADISPSVIAPAGSPHS